jgi:hypothetical protein
MPGRLPARSRMPTLGKLIAQPMANEVPPILTMQQKIDRWMINEGIVRCFDELMCRKSKNVVNIGRYD